jgi:hypothetical protein
MPDKLKIRVVVSRVIKNDQRVVQRDRKNEQHLGKA